MKSNKLIEKFWNWFEQSQLEHRKIIDERKTELIDDILNKLRKIQKGLAVEFEKRYNVYIMTISADGIEDNFEIVQNIISKAPLIKNWKFIAFRQPYTKKRLQNFVLTVSGYSLDPKYIWFLPIVEDDNLYIQIFSTDINEENINQISYGCLMLLDNIIGEYAVVKKVTAFEFYNLKEAAEFENELKPLTEISDYLNSYYQTI